MFEILNKAKRVLLLWRGKHDSSEMNKLDSLERQLVRFDSERLENTQSITQLQNEISELRALLVSARPNGEALWNQKSTLAATSTISTEGSIENTHGDITKIKVGEHSYIRGRLLTYGHGGQITVGDWCYVGVRTEIWSMESILIGNRVLISHDVNIHDGTAHSADSRERHEHFREILLQGHPTDKQALPGIKSSPIVIEDDAWISFGVTILRGVTIGAGSVIAAGSIVTKDVPPGMLYQCEIKPIMRPL